MHQYIKEILSNQSSNKEKQEELLSLKESIEIAEGVLNGQYGYCKLCNDYYLAKSFFTELETVDERVCTYSDPINSGGDEYETRKVTYTYKVCPKGHKHQINRQEHWK